MKKKISSLVVLFLLFVGLNTQTPYFYYYNGEKQYFELDTKHIFVSVTDENAAKAFTLNKVKYQALRADLPAKIQSKTMHKRFWTVLEVEGEVSAKAYQAKLSEIRNMGKNIITAPCFNTKHQDKIGLSNFFLVRLSACCATQKMA